MYSYSQNKARIYNDILYYFGSYGISFRFTIVDLCLLRAYFCDLFKHGMRYVMRLSH